MAKFDIAATLRWSRAASGRTLARREDEALPFATEQHLVGSPLLLDTCVYIDQLQGRAPAVVAGLVESREINHSTVAIQELMHAVGALRPEDGRTQGAIEAIARVISAMPDHRVFAPDADTLGRAALLSGVLARSQGYSPDGRLKALQDCTLFLQAQKLGLTVLTANLAEFDLLLQLFPSGRVLFYRCADRTSEP